MNPNAQIQCLLYQVSQVRLILQKRFRKDLKRTGLELSEFYALTVMQEHRIGLARDLALELSLSPATVSVMLRKMVRKKLVTETAGATDGKLKCLAVSAFGKKKFLQAKALLTRVDKELNRKFGREIAQFRAFYKKLIQENSQ